MNSAGMKSWSCHSKTYLTDFYGVVQLFKSFDSIVHVKEEDFVAWIGQIQIDRAGSHGARRAIIAGI
jgi:hypothetical protein